MTKDLEETLQELGPHYRAVVDRLVAGTALPFDPPRRRIRFPFSGQPILRAAAAAAVLVGAAVFFIGRVENKAAADGTPSATRLADAASEYRLAETRDSAAVREMIRTQNADGSWQTDFLTRRNAEALAGRPEIEAQIACKKARRNLRNRGLL